MTTRTTIERQTKRAPKVEPRRPRTRRGHDPEAAGRAALWANPAFQAALAEGRASLAKDGGIPGEELDERLGITDADRDEANAWLDEYERALAAEARAEKK